jgi:4-hydroxybenzoate polyprenyltransferase
MNIIKNTSLLIKSRPEAIFIWSWCTLIACLIVGRGYPPLKPTFTAIVSTALLTASAYIYNDLCDADMDKYNPEKRNRPLASGKVSASFAKWFIAITGILGLIISYSINLTTFIFSTIYYILYMLYSWPRVRFKKIFILKEIITCLAWPILALVGIYAVQESFNAPGMYAGLMMGVFSFLGLPALSDSFDEKEDSMFEVNSLARSLSWKRRIQLLGMAIIIMMTVTILTYAQLGFNTLLPITIITSSLVLLRFIIPIYDEFEWTKVQKVRSLTYYYVILSQIFIVIGSLNITLPL